MTGSAWHQWLAKVRGPSGPWFVRGAWVALGMVVLGALSPSLRSASLAALVVAVALCLLALEKLSRQVTSHQMLIETTRVQQAAAAKSAVSPASSGKSTARAADRHRESPVERVGQQMTLALNRVAEGIDAVREAVERIERQRDRAAPRSVDQGVEERPSSADRRDRDGTLPSRVKGRRGTADETPAAARGAEDAERQPEAQHHAARGWSDTELRDLADAWQQYRRDGDGFFRADDFRAVLSRRGIEASVQAGTRYGLRKELLVVVSEDHTQGMMVPSFNLAPRELEAWFQVTGDVRAARIGQLDRPARVRVSDHTLELLHRGAIQ